MLQDRPVLPSLHAREKSDPNFTKYLITLLVYILVFKQAMMTLQGMADHRFSRVSLFTNVFLGEIIFSP